MDDALDLDALTSQFADEIVGGQPQPSTAASAEKDDTAQADPASSSDAVATQAGDKADIKPDGILARDGKHVIPIEVLDKTRKALKDTTETAQTATTARLAAETKLAELQAQFNALQDGQSAKEVADIDEHLAAIQEDFPSVAEAMRAMKVQIATMQEESARHKSVSSQASNDDIVRQSQDAIDANPKLSHLQHNDAEGWQRAVKIDQQLMLDPAMANLPLAERFAKAAAIYEAMYAPIKTSSATVTTAAKPRLPSSMSAIPGGTPPVVDQIAELAEKSVNDTVALLATKSPKQMDAYIDALLAGGIT